MCTQLLYEKYRPRRFDEVLGQKKAIKKIKHALSRGWGGRSWWISGVSGVGKTTIARIIAKQGPQPDKVFVSEVDSASGINTKAIREMRRAILYTSLFPTAFIINEAHGLEARYMRSFLDILEHLKKDLVVIFTATKDGEKELLEEKIDTKPLLSRCIKIEL